MSAATLDRVLLSYPTVVNLKDATGTPPRSWIQLARTGAFVSKRYGKFDITTDDLRMMKANFRPDVTPIDYDHLTQDPQKPGDGIAAGWLKGLELRDSGNTLWGLVEWTPDAEKRIENREYRFISPSFMKDYKTPTGEKVGTKLLAAALTNLPFLPEMASVTLGADAVFGQFALSLPAESQSLMSTVHHLAERGQRVSVEQADELTPEERAMTFVVADVRGEGDDGFVFLKTLDGTPFGWFRAEQLAPARSTMASPIPPDRAKQEEEEMHDKMKPEEKLLARAQELASERQISLSAATKMASREDEAASREYLQHPEPTAEPSSVISLRRDDGETLPALVARVARERCNGDQVAAYRLVASTDPDLAEAYARGEF